MTDFDQYLKCAYELEGLRAQGCEPTDALLSQMSRLGRDLSVKEAASIAEMVKGRARRLSVTWDWLERWRGELARYDRGARPSDVHEQLWEAERAARAGIVRDLEEQLGDMLAGTVSLGSDYP